MQYHDDYRPLCSTQEFVGTSLVIGLLSISILLRANLLKSMVAVAYSSMLTCAIDQRETLTNTKSNFTAINRFFWKADSVIKVRAAPSASPFRTPEYLCILQLNTIQTAQLPFHSLCSLFYPHIFESHSIERNLVAMVTTLPALTPNICDAGWCDMTYRV